MLVAIIGTDTDVGKTWIACALAAALKATGRAVTARKPVQSHDGIGPSDAERLGAATGEEPEVVCPARWSFSLPMAPPMAADASGMSAPRVQELVNWVAARPASPKSGVCLVELVGGVCSPQADDGDGLDLLRLLQPDQIVLVAPAGLGTLNATRLTMRALGDSGSSAPVVVVLNPFDGTDELHRRNFDWLRDRDGFDVIASTPDGLAALTTRFSVDS
jgi:dethiobiotin synthetase